MAAADLDRLRRRYWWNIAVPMGVFAALALAPVVFGAPSAVTAVVAILATVGGVAASARLVHYRLSPPTEPSETASSPVNGRLVTLAVAAALAYVVAALVIDAAQFPDGGPALWFDRQTSWLWVPAVVVGAAAGTAFQRGRVVVVLVGALAAMGLAAGTQFLLTGQVVWPWMATEGALVAISGVALVYGLHEWDLTVRWDRAHKLEAELAVADERLRFAADLHDVQGHHLQVIALKSELAARLAESDPSAAAAHMREVQEQARSALADTREIVQGYRRAALGDELTNATRVLDAAGIDGRVDYGAAGSAEDIGEPGRQLLGLVVREATTNILRHSDASKARLTLEVGHDEARLKIHNDGAQASTGPAGSGLATLAGRLRAAGGALDWGLEGGWFAVTARVPVDAGPSA